MPAVKKRKASRIKEKPVKAKSPKGPLKSGKYISVEDFAAHFDTSVMSVYRLIRRGRIPHIRLGRVFKLPAKTIELYERQNIAGERELIERVRGK